MRAFDRDLIRGGHYGQHVYRANRPNTWLHRPSPQREDSPCQPGVVHNMTLCDGSLRRGQLPESRVKRKSSSRARNEVIDPDTTETRSGLAQNRRGFEKADASKLSIDRLPAKVERVRWQQHSWHREGTSAKSPRHNSIIWRAGRREEVFALLRSEWTVDRAIHKSKARCDLNSGYPQPTCRRLTFLTLDERSRSLPQASRNITWSLVRLKSELIKLLSKVPEIPYCSGASNF
jgi:hypothetical protein